MVLALLLVALPSLAAARPLLLEPAPVLHPALHAGTLLPRAPFASASASLAATSLAPALLQGALAQAPGAAEGGVSWGLLGAEAGAGAGAALLATPVALWGAAGLGTLSNNLVLAAVPAVLLLAALPPLAVTLVELLVGNALAPGLARFQPAFWVALGTHVLAIAGGIALGLSVQRFGDVALFTLAEAVLLPVATTLTLNTGTRSAPPSAALLPGAPGGGGLPLPAAFSLPLLSTRF
jgi:hypothetical protein